MIEIHQMTSAINSLEPNRDSPKMPNFPGLHGYPSHFGIDLKMSEEQITSIVHHVNFLIKAVPPDFQAPIWNLLGYIAHLKASPEESTDYYRTVLRLDPHNIVATSDLARCALEQGEMEECKELEEKIDTWLSKSRILKNRYVANAHLDIAFFYFYAGLTTATMYHLTTALHLNSTCLISRFYYCLFSYLSNRIGYHPDDISFHISSLNFINSHKPNLPIVEYLLSVIEVKSSFLPRRKPQILEDKLLTMAKNTTCPLILLLMAKELYYIEMYETAIDIVNRSLSSVSSATGNYLLALCLKKLYDRELESVLPDINVTTDADNTAINSGIQVIVETQHETKHTSTASYLPVTTIRECSVDQGSINSGRSRAMSTRKYSSKDLSETDITEVLSDVEEDTPIDPKLNEIFDHIRYACLLDPYDVLQLPLLTEVLVLCRKLDLAITYLHEILRRGTGNQKEATYLRLAKCYIDQKNAEEANKFLRCYRNGNYEVCEQYMNLVVKMADIFIKLKQPLNAKEWLLIMEQSNHPSCEHFTMRIKRLISKDKNLLDAFNMDKSGTSNKRKSSYRKKLSSTASIAS